MQLPVFLDRNHIDLAKQLQADFGREAGLEAAMRANQSRSLGENSNFCKWRQVERLIVLLSVDMAVGTIH